MSWYNNTSTDFIDGTQQFTGGSGNVSSGGGDVSDTPTGNITDLIQLVNNDTYVKNIYTNGRIYFFIKDADDSSGGNHNTRINKDGNLQYYHTYSILTPQKLSGWYDVGGAIAGLETGAIITGASVATNSTLIIQLETSLNTFLTTDYAPFKVATIQNDAIMYELINSLRTNKKGLANWSTSGMYGDKKNIQGAGERTADLLDAISDNLQQLTPPGSITNMGLSAPQVVAGRVPQLTAQVTELVATRANSLQGWLNNLGTGLTYAGIAGGVYAIYTLIDNSSEEEERDSLMGIANVREQIQRQIANGTGQDLQTNTYIYVDSLTIDQTTNTGYTTAGIYVVGITNDAILELKIENNSSSVLVASIVNVLKSSDQFSVNDEIFISKTDLDGTGTDLRIVVSALRSLEYIAEKNDLYLSSSIFERQNRQRRRQYIPNKDDFSTDGFNVNQTTTTEPTGESLSQIAISLKVDTSQFSYDATGNLQINNYGTIPVNPSQFQYIGGNLELINYSQINQNATDIGTIQGDVSTIQGNISTIQADQALQNTNITNNYNDIYSILNTQIPALQNSITTNGTNITNNTNAITTINNTLSALPTQGNLTEIYQLILNDGETPSTTTTKQVNIGFNKNEFDSIVFDLIMGAVKVSASVDTPFTITDFNNFFFGLYPNMGRLNYHDVITLVKQESTKYYNDNNWNSGGLVTRGAFYFKSEKSGEVYDLTKRFEYLGFHRFKTNVAGVNTYIIRTALEYEEQQDVPPYALLKAYQVDLNRLAFYLRDGRFYFSHLCRYTLDYWGINFTRNILNDFLAPQATYTNAVPTYGNYEAYKRIFVVSQPNNEDLFFKIEDAYHPLSQTTFDSLIDTNPNNNPHFMGMLQNYDGTTYNHDPFGTINTFIVSTNTLIHIARIEIEYKIMRWEAFNSTWFDDIPNTQAKVANLWEELVFEFYDTYTDTIPAQTILLDTRQVYTTSTNTIIIDFDKSPDLYSYLHKKWKIRPRFNSAYTSYPQTATNSTYRLTANQRSAFIVKVNLVPYVLKTLQREQVEEFSDGTQHTLSAFDYNKIYFYARLNNNSATPFNDIYYKLNDNLDANKYQITIPQTFYTSQLSDLTDLPPNVTQLETNSFNFLTDDFFVSPSQQTITLDNSILIIGDENINVDEYQTHFNWRFLQSTDVDLTETNLNDYDYLKTYNYYHQTAKCDRFFSCKEFYADMIDFKNIQIGGSLAYEEMDTSEFGTLSQASDGFTLKSLSSQNIQNLYGLTADGYVYYDTITGFTTNPVAGGYGDADVRLLLSTSMGDTMRWDSTNNKIIAEPDMLSIKNRAFDIFGNDIMRFTYTEPTASTYNITLDRQHKSNLSSNNRSVFSKTQFDEKEPVETFNFTETTLQFNSQGIGSGVPDSTGITFEWVALGGDIIRYSGASQRWGVYWTDDPRGLYGGDKTTMVIGDFTLLYMLNDGDDILCDPARYRIQSTSEFWLIKDADIVEKIKLSIYFPDVYIHTFRTGYKISMEASDTAPNAISNVRDKVDLFYFNSSRVFHTAFEVADRSQYNPIPTLLEGVPVQYNNDYRWAWKVNQGHIMNLYEEGSLFLTGNIYVKCAVGINRVEKGDQIIVNSIENLSKTNLTNTPITGIPPLVPQIFTFNIDNITTSGGLAILTISGTDRVATYTNVLSTNFPEFHIYNGDYIRITLSQPAINYLVNTFDCEIQIPSQKFDTFTLNQSTGLYEAFVSNNSGLPYIQHYIYSSVIPQGQSAIVGNLIYFQAVGLQDLIDIRLNNLQGSYTNTAYNPTDIFTLNYYPYNNDYGWALNTAGLGYTDQDVKVVLSNSAGTGLTWNATNEEFDNTITQYANSDVYAVLNSAQTTHILWDNVANTLSLTGVIPISLGGTGGTTASQARTALGVDISGTDNSTNVTLASVANNYLTISGQTITAGQVPISLGGTGASTKADAVNNILPTATTNQYLRYDGIDWTSSSGVDTLESMITRDASTDTYLYSQQHFSFYVQNTDLAIRIFQNKNLKIFGQLNFSDNTLQSTAGIPLPSNPATNDYLKYDGTNWVSAPISGGGTSYTDADVRNVLSQSGSANIAWDSGNNWFELAGFNAQQVVFGGGYGILQSANFTYNFFTQTLSVTNISANGSALTNLNAGNITTGTLALTRGGTGATNQAGACLNILPPALPGQYLRYDGINWQGNYIPQYTDTDVKSVLSTAGGIGINWNPSVEQFDLELAVVTDNFTYVTSGNTPKQPFLEINDDGVLFIKGSGRSFTGFPRYYARHINNGVGSFTFDYCLRLNSAGIFIGGGNYLALLSSKKIKKDIIDITGEEALDLSLRLKPKKYKMKDYIKHGDKYSYGYISEEVFDVLPELTGVVPAEIPNIYEMAKVISKDTIQIDKELKVGETYIYYFDNDKQMEFKVIEKQDDNKYKVIAGIAGDEELPKCDEIFIFGIYEDSLVLKYDQFHAIHTKSIQHLQGIISKQQEQIDKLMEILQRNGIS